MQVESNDATANWGAARSTHGVTIAREFPLCLRTVARLVPEIIPAPVISPGDKEEACVNYCNGRIEIDELPIGMLVLLICLMWLSWRRYEHARRELNARRVAEARLGVALAENRQLAQENLRIQEMERKHLARELHDEFGQYLNAIKLDAVSIRESGGHEPQLSTRASMSIVRSIDHVHRAVSDMIGRLRPVGLDELGL
jgi:signal transduction histidine kinase